MPDYKTFIVPMLLRGNAEQLALYGTERLERSWRDFHGLLGNHINILFTLMLPEMLVF